jgi:hypothetical protein
MLFTHLVFQHRIDTQNIKGILLRLLPSLLPLLLLAPAQIMWRVHIAGLPFAVYLALELGEPVGLLQFARRGCAWAVETDSAGEAEGGRITEGLWARGGFDVRGVAGGAAAAEDVEDVFWGGVRGVGVVEGRAVKRIPCFWGPDEKHRMQFLPADNEGLNGNRSNAMSWLHLCRRRVVTFRDAMRPRCSAVDFLSAV